MRVTCVRTKIGGCGQHAPPPKVTAEWQSMQRTNPTANQSFRNNVSISHSHIGIGNGEESAWDGRPRARHDNERTSKLSWRGVEWWLMADGEWGPHKRSLSICQSLSIPKLAVWLLLSFHHFHHRNFLRDDTPPSLLFPISIYT